MNYNKLVRDHIPTILEDKDIAYTSHIADDNEYWTKLQEKLSEEVAETLSEMKDGNDTKITEELADVLEVIHAIAKYRNISLNEIEHIRKTKKDQRGGFDQRIILEETTDGE